MDARLDEHALSVLDLGSGAVKALVVGRRGTSQAVLGMGVAAVPPRSSDQRDVRAVLEACERALEQAEDDAGVVPVQAALGLTDSRTVVASGSARVLRVQPDAPLSADEARTVVARAERAALQAARQRDAAEYASAAALRPLNATVTRLTLDRRPVTALDPAEALRGQQVEVTVAAAFASDDVVNEAVAIAEQLDLELRGLWCLPFTAAAVTGQRDALVIDVGATVTSVSLVSGGWCTASATLPLGAAALAQQAATELGLSPADAVRAIEAHAAGAGRRGPGGAATRGLPWLAAHFAHLWRDALAGALPPLAYAGALPSRLILVGGGSDLPELWDVLREPEWSAGLPFGQLPVVERASEDASALRVAGPLRMHLSQLLPALALGAVAEGMVAPVTKHDTLLRQSRPHR